MSRLLHVLAVLLCVAPSSGIFHCARDPVGCSGSNGICNPIDGTCACTSGVFDGKDCSAIIANACTDPNYCGTNGVCHLVGTTTDTCVCNKNYTGPTCTIQVPSLTCDADKFILTMPPFSPAWVATSTVYPAPSQATTCVTGTGPYNILFSGSTTCGITVDTVSEAGKTIYNAKIIFQYEANKLSSTDIILTIQCKFGNQQTVESSTVESVTFAEGGLINVAGGLLNQVSNPGLVASTDHKPTATGTYAPVDGTYVASMGHIIRLGVDLPTTSTAYGKIRIESCTVDDSTATGGVLNIITGSCVSTSGAKVIQDLGRDATTPLRKVEVSIKAFLYLSPLLTRLRIKCIVKLCLVGSTGDCDDVTTCAPAFSQITLNGAGRKKRAADDKSDTAEVFTVVPVRSPFDTNANTQTSTQTECEMSHEFIIVIVVLCVFILLLAVACVFFAMRYIRNRGDKSDDMRTVYSARS